MEALGPSVRRIPRWTAQVYALAATTWIVGSDFVVTVIRDASFSAFAVNSAKGLVFVGLTTAVLWVVLHRWADRVGAAWDAVLRERTRFEVLVEGTEDIIGVLDDDGAFSYVSPSLERILGWSAGDLLGTRARVIVHPDDMEAAVGYIATVRREATTPGAQTFRFLTPNGRWRHIELLGSNLRHEPSVRGIVVHGRDVTDRYLAESRLQHALTHDAVTGLPGRARFEDDLRDAALGAEARNQHLLVLTVDLLAFREVNEAVGRTGGDDVLREVARRIGADPDVTSVSRLGADEFGIALPITGDASRVEREADRVTLRVSESLGAPFVVADRRFHLSAHIGGAVVTLPGPIDRGLLTAETNRQAAKRHPDRTVVTVLSQEPGSSRSGTMVAEALHDALASDELVLHYQPQYDLASGEMVAAEALIRWQHPTDGLLGPRTFLAEATRGTLLPIVTRFVLSRATAQVASWTRSGHRIAVSVNLSLGDLRRHSIVDEVVQAVETSGIDPTLLRLELTEQTLLTEPERSLAAIQALRAEGIQFSIDDFGTGYSSLMHLRTLPVDELKIDRVFIAGMCEGGVDDAIVNAVMELGHRTGLVIVAEGIEDLETYRVLAVRGCDRGQGYLMSRPVPAHEVSFATFDPDAVGVAT